MGYVENVTSVLFPRQGPMLGRRVRVMFHYTEPEFDAECIRDDYEAPWLTIFRLNDGRVVLSTECQYSDNPQGPPPMSGARKGKRKKRERVVMTVLGYKCLVKPWTRRLSARVTSGVAIWRDPPFGIVVLRDGHKTPEHYHRDFWELAR